MVGKRYLLEKPPGPAKWKVTLDQEVFPVFIDLAGDIEQVVERVAVGARQRPFLAVGLGVGIGWLLGFAGRFRRERYLGAMRP